MFGNSNKRSEDEPVAMEEDDAELSVKQLIQVELCALDAVLSTVEVDDPKFREVQTQLQELLADLEGGRIQPERAEVKYEQIREGLWTNGTN
jgi:hypothetical protein